MANAVEDALNRASEEQRARAQQVIEEARNNIRLVSVQQGGDISPSSADTIARNAQAIEEAKRSIPFETMQEVNSIGPPPNTPFVKGSYPSNVVELHPDIQASIEQIEKGEGNNYLRENAVDRAMARQPQDIAHEQEQRQAISR